MHSRVLLTAPARPELNPRTGRGPEFIGDEFQKAFCEQKTKFRLIKSRSPHLNCKTEHLQQTGRIEFWATVDCSWTSEALILDVAT